MRELKKLGFLTTYVDDYRARGCILKKEKKGTYKKVGLTLVSPTPC